MKTKPAKDTLEAALKYARRRLPEGWQLIVGVAGHSKSWGWIQLNRESKLVDVFYPPTLNPTAIRRAVRLARREAGL